jgi:toxin-antitoxin system PIN domain toxin
MRLVDVNLLIYAHRREAPEHRASRDWLVEARRAVRPLAIADVVQAGFLRIVTNGRVFRDPTPFNIAVQFLDALMAGPAVRRVAPGERHWDLFLDLCRRGAAKGNLISDAWLAAIALEQGATLVTADRDFLRFPGVPLENPLERGNGS